MYRITVRFLRLDWFRIVRQVHTTYSTIPLAVGYSGANGLFERFTVLSCDLEKNLQENGDFSCVDNR